MKTEIEIEIKWTTLAKLATSSFLQGFFVGAGVLTSLVIYWHWIAPILPAVG